MTYTQDEFLQLMDEVEFQGGTYLDVACEPKFVYVRLHPKGPKRRVSLSRCGNNALFDVPYGLEKPSKAEEVGLIQVCAVEDDMGKWPRFRHKLEALG